MVLSPLATRPPLGFALVTHRDPEQTLHLCERLTQMFSAPPIAIHHDFSQCRLDRSSFPANVRFVEDWVRTGWGTIGVVDALLSTMRLLFRANDGWGDPEWVTSLSSADYPIQTAEAVLHDLQNSPYDGYLDSRRINFYPGSFVDAKLGEFPFQQPRYHQFAFNRYMAIPLLSIRLARRLKVPVERFTLRSRWITEHLTPFRSNVACYAGDAWMTIRRRVALFLLDETPFWHTLRRHLHTRQSPEECFYHTLLGNASGFQICADNLRYTDWKDSYAHPRTLGRDDFPRLVASHQHFARKFPFDPVLLSELDEVVAAQAGILARERA